MNHQHCHDPGRDSARENDEPAPPPPRSLPGFCKEDFDLCGKISRLIDRIWRTILNGRHNATITGFMAEVNLPKTGDLNVLLRRLDSCGGHHDAVAATGVKSPRLGGYRCPVARPRMTQQPT
jgi:hypothetical protein